MKAEHQRIDAFELWCWRRLLRVPWTARRSHQSVLKEISPEYSWKDWCWGWNSNTLATWCEELTPWKLPWCWESLRVGGEGEDRGWDGWMASLTWWTWVWVDSGSWWWTGRPGMLQFRGRKESDTTERLNWTECQKSYLLRPPQTLFPAIVSPLSQKHILFFYGLLLLTWENVWISVLKSPYWISHDIMASIPVPH